MGFLPKSRKISSAIREFVELPLFDQEASPESDPAWPRISVITPSFNQAPFLERTLWSIHNQGYPNLEHIVIDGGSTDGSIDIIRKFERRLAYWQSEPDDGQCHAINIGATRATGAFMTWINSDDLLLSGSLNRIGELIQRYPDTDLFYGNQVEVDQVDRVTKRVYTIDFDLRDFLYEIHIIIHQQSAFWRTDLFRRLGGLNDCAYAMDYDLFYRMIASGIRWLRIEDFLAAFRMYPDSLTGTGKVARLRTSTVDRIFEEATGHQRTFWDRSVMAPLYKTRRFLAEPRSLIAALENRIWRSWSGITNR
jgi:glycosyltransferase involved in cell wall biosynthesis